METEFLFPNWKQDFGNCPHSVKNFSGLKNSQVPGVRCLSNMGLSAIDYESESRSKCQLQ
jgi:hypothetical protein